MMDGVNVNINQNNGNISVGGNQTISYNFTCHCGGVCHNNVSGALQGTSTSTINDGHDIPDGSKLNVLSAIQNVDSKVCLCRAVYKYGNNIELGSGLSKVLMDLIRDRNCTYFEVQLKVKSQCKMCKGNSVETTTYASHEFSCTLTNPTPTSLSDKPLRLIRINSQPDSETAFQSFLAKSESIVRTEGDFIRIITKICNTKRGKTVKIKLQLDVKKLKSSVKRRANSFSEFGFAQRQLLSGKIAKSNSFRNVNEGCSSKTRASLHAITKSSITILDGEVNVNQESGEPEAEFVATTVESLESSENLAIDRDDVFDLNGLENQDAFASGKFGPLYKVRIKEREQLVKIVKKDTETEKFLEEAKEFQKCRHPYIRPVAKIFEEEERWRVFYWFVNGPSLFQAIEDNIITNYLDFCRILCGMVRGLIYLQRKRISCQFLTPEKVLLDSHFNPRITGVGLAYFQTSEHAEASHGDLHRSVSYLDPSLRNSKEFHPNNVLWSVGRCIWDMLLRRICQMPDQEDLLSKYHILEHLQESCTDDRTIKTTYFNQELRKIVYGGGWPRNNEITKTLVVCAVRCMLLDLNKRMSLESLNKVLEDELQKQTKFCFYKIPDNLCLYCTEKERGKLRLTCGCTTACIDCLRSIGELDCPEHGLQFSEIGHPLTYGVLLQGEFPENKTLSENDARAMESLLNDQNVFAVKNFERMKSESEKKACDELKRIKTKIMNDKKRQKESEKYPSTLLLYITGHCNNAGNLILPDGSILNKKKIQAFISDINPKHLVVLANGHYSEKLVSYISKMKYNMFASSKFFGLFSHAGSLCGVAHNEISDENSILVSFIQDILTKDPSSVPCSSTGVAQTHLTVAGLTDEISRRMEEKFNKRLKPFQRDGARIPIAYLN